MAFVEWIKKLKGEGANSIHSSLLTKTYNGPAVVCTDNDSNVHYVDPNRLTKKTIDDMTEWTCRFGYYNGYPCMFITFKTINPSLRNSNYILCLEWENPRKGETPKIHALNVYNRGSDVLNPSLNNITYISMTNIVENKEYCIYLVAHEYITRHGYHRFSGLSEQSDWRVQLKVRPTIRKINNNYGTTRAYNFQKNMIDFTYVDYLLIDEYKI